MEGPIVWRGQRMVLTLDPSCLSMSSVLDPLDFSHGPATTLVEPTEIIEPEDKNAGRN